MKKIIVALVVPFLLSFAIHAQEAAPVQLFIAKAVILFKTDAGDSEKMLTANLPKGDLLASVDQVRNSQVFEILVSAPDPKAAAKRANQIALSLQSLINDPDDSNKVLLILQKATAADTTPSKGNTMLDAAPSGNHRKIAVRTLEDLRLLDSATDQYAIETNKMTGFKPSFADLKNYLRAGTTLYNTGADPLGAPYGPFTVDSIPKVSDTTFNALSDVADENFWSPYK